MSKFVTICGFILVAITTSGCLKGPIAEGQFSFFPDGVNFDGNGNANK